MTTSNQTLASINFLVSVGSVDGVLTSAAMLRLIGNPECGLTFTQAFTVDKIDLSNWAPGRNVALVDLAVNNREPAMTAAFVERLKAAGHQLVAIVDEHSRKDWTEILGDFSGLLVEPQSQAEENGPKSSGELLRRALPGLGIAADEVTLELLADADKADAMDFSGRFASAANQAVKSAIADDSRRVHIARHFAQSDTPSPEMVAWIKEYEAIVANHSEIIAAKVDQGDGIIRVNAVGRQVDMTTLMNTLYKGGARIVALEGEVFVPAKKAKEVLVAYGTADKGLDLLAVVKSAGINPLGGFAQKVNVDLEDEAAATEAVRAALLAQ